MRLSVVMATHNKAPYLRRTLKSIFVQSIPFPHEVVVVDDGSQDETPRVCKRFPVKYARLDRPYTGNNAIPFNIGYRMAQGEIILTTSDEVEHRTPDLIGTLVEALKPGLFVSPKVYNVAADGTILADICTRSRKPQLVCAAIWRKDLYAVGGHDEEFTGVGSNDTFLLKCLAHLPLRFAIVPDLVAYHYDHPKPIRGERKLLFRKIAAASVGLHPWTAKAGAWTP